MIIGPLTIIKHVHLNDDYGKNLRKFGVSAHAIEMISILHDLEIQTRYGVIIDHEFMPGYESIRFKLKNIPFNFSLSIHDDGDVSIIAGMDGFGDGDASYAFECYFETADKKGFLKAMRNACLASIEIFNNRRRQEIESIVR